MRRMLEKKEKYASLLEFVKSNIDQEHIVMLKVMKMYREMMVKDESIVLFEVFNVVMAQEGYELATEQEYLEIKQKVVDRR